MKSLVRSRVTADPDCTMVKTSQDFYDVAVDIEARIQLQRATDKKPRKADIQYFLMSEEDIPQLDIPAYASVPGTRTILHTRVVAGQLQVRDYYYYYY